MKKVIDGALYNTDTAQPLGTGGSGGSSRDFQWYEEVLYRTKSGKFFLYGEGGPMTKYAESCGQNQWSGGSHIEPLSLMSAMRWAEEHLTADEYSLIFGEPEEAAEGKRAINITLSNDLIDVLDRMKSTEGVSISAMLEAAIREKYSI